MEVTKINKWIVCRICLNSDNALVNIFDVDGPVEHLVNKIEEFGGIKLDSTTDLPDSICCKCLTLLKAAHKFRGLCQRSKVKLEHLLQSPIDVIDDSSSTIPDQIEEELPACKPTVDEIEQKSTVTKTTFELMVKKEEEPEYIDEQEEDDMLEYIEVPNPEEEYFMTYDSIDQFEIVKQNDESVSTDLQFTYLDDGELEDDASQFEIVEPKTKVKIIQANNSDSDHDTDSIAIVPKYSAPVKTQPRKRKANAILPRSAAAGEEEPSYICSYCGNMYNEKAKLTLHLKNHTKEKPHECEICKKRFAQTPQLARHMNSHTGSRPFKCKYCSASFADPSTCIKHQRIHTNERPYKCDTCGKSFSYSNVLKVHMMTHTGEKPYSCERCGKKFAQLHHKKAHERTHSHEIALDLVEDTLNN